MILIFLWTRLQLINQFSADCHMHDPCETMRSMILNDYLIHTPLYLYSIQNYFKEYHGYIMAQV